VSALDILVFMATAFGFMVVLSAAVLVAAVLEVRGIVNLWIGWHQLSFGVMGWGVCVAWIHPENQILNWREGMGGMKTWVVKFGNVYFTIGEG
jgi:hypothetical protein